MVSRAIAEGDVQATGILGAIAGVAELTRDNLVGAFVLAALEALLPGAVMISFAISAALIGMLLVVLPLPWQWQWVLWAVLGVGTAVRVTGSDGAILLVQRAESP